MTTTINHDEYARLLRGCRLSRVGLVTCHAELRASEPELVDRNLAIDFEGHAEPASAGRYRLSIEFTLAARETENARRVGLKMKARFAAWIESDEALPDAFLQQYVESNLLFNLWPYWRQWVAETSGRLGLPPITLGFYFAPAISAGDEPAEG